MKKILLLIILTFQLIISYSQVDYTEYNWDIFEDDNIDYNDPSQLKNSKNGFILSPHGEIRCIVAFVELIYRDSIDDPCYSGTTNWPKGELPIWKDELFKIHASDSSTNCHITNYYSQASSNNHIVLGDYLMAPDNGGVFQVNTINGRVDELAVINVINQKLGDSIITAGGLTSISDFDKWTPTHDGVEKVDESNNRWDFFVIVVRNSKNPKNTNGFTWGNTSSNYSLLGYSFDACTIVCTNSIIPTHIIRHEYAHMLLGGNNFHSGGGGWGSGKGNYWIPQVGGWGLLGLYNCSLWSWSAWDRQRLGWKHPSSNYEISARNSDNTLEVNGDLDATIESDAGVYTLRDFVTYGDAIRIKLPFINDDNEYQQWLWIENHQGTNRNGSEFDQWQYEAQDCVEDFEPGLMMYMQINNDIRESYYYDSIYGNSCNIADYNRPLTANGFWDREFIETTVNNECVSYAQTRPFVLMSENPFTGGGDQEFYSMDLDNNNKINRLDQLNNWVEYNNEEYNKHLYQLGNPRHVFNLNGNHKLGIGTNPSSATLMNMVGEETQFALAKNIRTTYLNGISVEILNEDSLGNIQIQIRFDDVDIDRDVRWCSDSIVLNHINTPSGYSLNVKEGKTILLDQGLTATRVDNPMFFGDKKVFADPTSFIVNQDAKIHINQNAKILLTNGSKMELKSSSYCVVDSSAVIEVTSGTKFYLNECATLKINGTGKLIVRSGATLCISPEANLFFQNGQQNIILESDVIIPSGYVNPINIINNTLTDPRINVTTTWLNKDYTVIGDLIIDSSYILTIKSSKIRFSDENSRIIINPGAKLIVDGSILTSTCNDMWQGIEVWGNADEHQNIINGICEQGVLQLENETVIENAVCAVQLWKPGDYSKTGGIVHATNTVFINNTKSIYITGYQNYNPFNFSKMIYNSSFTDCTFEITSDYSDNYMFEKHVDINSVDGVRFIGCDFVLDNDNGNISAYNNGIFAYNASFYINSVCESNIYPCPEESYDRSSFEGFYNAIRSVNDGSNLASVFIRRADFYANRFAILARNANNISVVQSYFDMGEAQECGAGIFIDGSTGFTVEENTFTKNTISGSSDLFGIIINNSQALNEIYKNSFDNLTCANYSNGKNWLDDWINYGLIYSCNDNSKNQIDFYVADYSQNNHSGIQSFQGSSSKPSGNTFSQENITAWNFYNGGEYIVQYYYNQNGQNEMPDKDKINRIFSTAVNASNDCSSHYGNMQNVSMTLAERAQKEQEYYNAYANYNSIKALYDNYVDGGNTNDELTDIRNANPSNAWSLRTQLLGHSPHLSQAVLMEAANRTDVFSDTVLFEILAANPDELRKDTLINFLADKETPLPDYMIDLLSELSSDDTYKTVLQQQMTDYRIQYSRCANDIIKSILNDTIVNYSDLRNWLDNLGGISADRQIISTFINEGNFNDALLLADALPQLYNLQGMELMENNYYVALLKFYQDLQIEGRNIYQLDSTEIVFIKNIADNGIGIAKTMAVSVMEGVYGSINYVTCPELTISSTQSESKGNVNTQQNIPNENDELFFNIKSNPNNEYAIIEYMLPQKNDKIVSITINDLMGRIIKVVELDDNQGQTVLDTHELPTGVYIVSIRSSEFFRSKKFVVR